MTSWKERGRGGSSINFDGTASATAGDSDGSLPLGPGEWTEPLGLPLVVVCQNVSATTYFIGCVSNSFQAQKIEFLEKSQGWKEPDFDTVLQYLRTVLLRRMPSPSLYKQYLILTQYRRRLSHLHQPKCTFSTSIPDTFNARHNIPPQAPTAKAQCHRPRQNRGTAELGLVGQDSRSGRRI
jgi:hypothetical protein